MDDNMMDKVKQLLDDPDTMQTLTRMIGDLGGTQSEAQPSQSHSDTANEMEMLSKVKSVMERMNSGPDPRINLLSALKPYMRRGRAAHMDKAIRMLQMTRMTSILKDLT